MVDEDRNTEAAPGEELLTIDEAAKFLGTSKSTLYRLLAQEDVKGTKVGKQWRFRKADLAAYLDRTPVAIAVDSGSRAELDEAVRAIADDLDGEWNFPEMTDEGKVVCVAQAIVQSAVRQKASDIHVEPMQKGLRIRFRLDGVLQEIWTFPKSLQEALLVRFKAMADMQLAERRVPQDGRIPISFRGGEYELRVSVVPSYFGENIVMRILDKTSVLLGLQKVGLSEIAQARIDRMVHRGSGTIISTGPTGSGKTTLLYSMLHQINAADKHVMTIEDPVEYQLPGITQVQVNKRAGLTFAAGLRSFLRQDPDTIMVGELRDLETAQIVVEAALTGHLVLTTLHTEDAPGALTRLADMGIERYLIGGTVVGVVATRLARKLCPDCKTLGDPAEAALEVAKVRPLASAGGFEMPVSPAFYEAVGCEHCRGTGFRGRIGLFEVLTCDRPLISRLLQAQSSEEMTQIAVGSGMRTLLAEGIARAVEGVTSIDEVLRATGTWI
jgi:excisionase family DNA binding protein